MSYIITFLIVSIASVGLASPTRRAMCGPGDKTLADLAKGGSYKDAVPLVDDQAMDMFSGSKDYTVFTPVMKILMNPEDVEGQVELRKDKAIEAKVFRYYLVEGEISFDEFKEGPLTTVLGQDLNISKEDGKGGCDCACNGVVHVINSVLYPDMDLIKKELMEESEKNMDEDVATDDDDNDTDDDDENNDKEDSDTDDDEDTVDDDDDDDTDDDDGDTADIDDGDTVDDDDNNSDDDDDDGNNVNIDSDDDDNTDDDDDDDNTDGNDDDDDDTDDDDDDNTDDDDIDNTDDDDDDNKTDNNGSTDNDVN
eukprot:Awhi_evm1s13170